MGLQIVTLPFSFLLNQLDFPLILLHENQSDDVRLATSFSAWSRLVSHILFSPSPLPQNHDVCVIAVVRIEDAISH